MSVVICCGCEMPVDIDLQGGYYCETCESFACDDCIWDMRCPVCETEIEE